MSANNSTFQTSFSTRANSSSNNATVESERDIMLDILLPLIFALICTFGIAGNTLVIIVVKKTRSLHSTTNILLANLAFADLLTLVFGIPNAVAIAVGQPDGIVGTYLCKLLTAGNINGVTITASVLTLTLLAVERYNAIVKPMQEKRRLKKQDLKYAIFAIWTLSIVIIIPMFVKTVYNKGCSSDWDKTQELTYKSTLIFLLFVTPFGIIGFCYGAVLREIYFSSGVAPTAEVVTLDANAKRKILRILLLVTLFFLVCFGAYGTVMILYELKCVGLAVYNTSVQCLFAQSSVNPVIYAVQSTNYRQALLETVRCHGNMPQPSAQHQPRQVTIQRNTLQLQVATSTLP